MLDSSKSTILSTYRSFRRKIRLLPSEYIRQFFRIKLADDVRSVLSASTEHLRSTKLKRVQQELRKLQAAHDGDHQAYAHVLDVAYGRKGKLRWEIMTPLLSDPNSPLPDRIIPGVEKSRPPVYSPELTALLTSGLSRSTAKPLSHSALVRPPTLPDRADRESEDARLLGPFSKRREVNIRWRFFTDQREKVYPPLQVVIAEQSLSDAQTKQASDETSIARAGIRPVGLQGASVCEDLVTAAGPAVSPHTLTRRERAEGGANLTSEKESTPLPRFIRRRYRELLARTPILTYQPWPTESNSSATKRGRYVVSCASNALDSDTRGGAERVPEGHASYLVWAHGETAQRPKGKKG